MIRKIKLHNFRCFSDHELSFNRSAVIVGRNNAGKSTLVEALRLVAFIADRYKTSLYFEPPRWTELPKRDYGIRPAIHALFDPGEKSLFHQYGDPPAIIEANFTTGHKIDVYLGGEDRIHAVVRDRTGKAVHSKKLAKELGLPSISILPPVAPLRVTEKVLSEDHVRQHASTHLAPLHFRNQLLIGSAHFKRFADLCQSMWPRLQVQSLERSSDDPGATLSLLVRDDEFVAEVGRMGDGLQIWMQIMWYLARSERTSTIILDEPDIYLHADLQRKLLRSLQGRFKQVLIATHSVEIMSEVEPDDIMIVERAKPVSKYAADIDSVQRVIEHMGGVHNLHLARLAMARKCILVEGKDLRLLKLFQDILFPNSEMSFGSVPSFPVGGWDGWREAIGSTRSMRNSLGQRVEVYCLFDRDYRDQVQCEERYGLAGEASIRLHVWRRKEIENYLLVPAAIARAIALRSRASPDPEEIRTRLDEICESAKNDTIDALTDGYCRANKGDAPSVAMKYARNRTEAAWASLDAKLGIVSGKAVLSALSGWSQAAYGASISPAHIVRSMQPGDVLPEMKAVVTAIEDGRKMPEVQAFSWS